VNVNRETALTLDAYFRCVSLLSGDVGKMPLSIYRRAGGGSRIEDMNHPAYPLLNFQVSDEISSIEWKRVMVVHACAEGNGYSYICRNGKGEPIEIWPLSPMKTYPVREGNKLWYVTQVGNAGERKLPAEDVFHLKGLSFDGLVGYSVVAKMRETLGEGLGQQNFATVFLRNNARPNVVLITPHKLKPEARVNLRESWERMHSGLENAHRTAVLDGGLDIKTISQNVRETIGEDARRFNRTAIANFFGVPAVFLNEREANTSYNSIEALREGYVEDGGGLGYWLPAFAIEAWRKLTSDWQQRRMTHVIEFNTRRLLRANLQARTQYYTQMLQNGVLCPDEVRAEEGYNPRSDGKGGDFMQPLNMKSGADELGPDADTATDPPGALPKPPSAQRRLPAPARALPSALVDAQAALIADAVRRLVRRVSHQAQRAARKPGDFLAWLDRLEAEEGPTAALMLEAPLRAALALKEVGHAT
jgi:HK97 family phage portal protein